MKPTIKKPKTGTSSKVTKSGSGGRYVVREKLTRPSFDISRIRYESPTGRVVDNVQIRDMTGAKSFKDLGLEPNSVKTLNEMRYEDRVALLIRMRKAAEQAKGRVA